MLHYVKEGLRFSVLAVLAGGALYLAITEPSPVWVAYERGGN